MLAFIAQLAAENPTLYGYGPLGVMCAFFMWRDVQRERERIIERTLFIGELRAVRHSTDGLQRAFLVTTLEQAVFPASVKDYAQKQITKIDARMAKEEQD